MDGCLWLFIVFPQKNMANHSKSHTNGDFSIWCYPSSGTIEVNLPLPFLPRHTEGAAEEDALHRCEGHQTLGEASLFVHPLHGPPRKIHRLPNDGYVICIYIYTYVIYDDIYDI